MPTRVQYQFVTRASDPLSSGWTENFYSSITPAAAALADATTNNWINARLKLLSDDYRLSQVKCVQVGLRTDSASKIYGGGTGIGQYPPPAGDVFTGEQVWDACLVALKSSTGHLRNFPMRGIPTGVFKDTMTIFPGAWLTNFNQWVTILLGGHGISGFQIRIPTYVDTAFPASVTVVNGGRALSLLYAGAPPGTYVRGAVLRVRGLTGATPVNHLWRIQDFVPPFTVITYPGRRTIYGTPAGAGVATDRVVYTYDGINTAEAVRAMERKTGRPPALLRGRALVRRA